MHKGMTGRQGEQGPASVKTIGEYIQQKYASDLSPPKPKLTFEEWWNAPAIYLGRTRGQEWEKCGYSKSDCSIIWKAAQENA